jgi:high-affinity iron transporter
MAGGALGVAAGVLVGVTLFRGLLRIPLKWFFSVTSALVLLLAAGMAAQAARFLIQADVLPSLASPLWDTSSVVSNSSVLGKALTGLVGYDAQPAGMQIAAFVVALGAIAFGMALVRRRDAAPPHAASAPSTS